MELRPVDVFLLIGALFAWSISLFLPAFASGDSIPPPLGGAVLLFGILFGWFVHGWAAYANLFFVYAAWRLCLGKTPRLSVVLMLAFAASLPLFSGMLDKSGGRSGAVASWGWGAFMWLWSLALLAGAAAARRRIIGARGALALGLLMLSSGMAASALHARQWRAAGIEDRRMLLAPGMIYTSNELCYVALTWPAPSTTPGGEAVVLDVDAQLLHAPPRGPSLDLPGGFTEAHADGAAWRAYPGAEGDLKVRQAAQPGALLLQVKATGDGAVIRLLQGQPRRLLYEQPVKSVAAGRSRSFCPVAGRALHGGLRSDYGEALLRAMGQPPRFKAGVALAHAEVARERCPIGIVEGHRIRNLRSLDGREVILAGSMERMAGLCSANYVALAGGPTLPGNGRLRAVVHVLDRRTLRPLAMFDGVATCPPSVCAPGREATVDAVRLEGERALVETSRGEYAAALKRF